MARRHVDDESVNFALPAGLKFGREHLDVPVHEELSVWIELLKAALNEGAEVLAEYLEILVETWIHRLALAHATFLPSPADRQHGTVGTVGESLRDPLHQRARLELSPVRGPRPGASRR